MSTESAPLKASVRDNKLVIEIGVETLAWASASLNGGPFRDLRVDGRRRKEFAQDVAAAMSLEDEVGNTDLCDFFDKMMLKAADRGSGAIIWSQERKRR